MRLLTFQHEGLARPGVELGEYVLDLPAAGVEMGVPDLASCEDMLSFLQSGEAAMEAARSLVTEIWRQIDARQLEKLLDRGILRTLGRHQADGAGPSVEDRRHRAELSRPRPRAGLADSGAADHLRQVPDVGHRSRRCHRLGPGAYAAGRLRGGAGGGHRPAGAQRQRSRTRSIYVAGYTCANDVSARDLQFGDRQWVRGKSLDTFCPLGPVIVTPDEIADPQNLSIRAILNGETMQDSRTSEMIFGVRELIAFASRAFTLLPGDVILTGTPHGVGVFRKPPVFLKDGDAIAVEIEKIGRLENVCRTA